MSILIKKQPWSPICLIITLLLLSCIATRSEIKKTAMSIKIETLLTTQWGHGNRQIPMILVEPIQTSILSPFPIRKIRKAVQVFVTPSGQVSLLSSENQEASSVFIDSFSSTGEYINRVSLQLEKTANVSWMIQDFITIQDGSAYTLEFFWGRESLEQFYRVRYTQVGATQSKIIYQDSLEKDKEPQLLVDGNLKVYLARAIEDNLQIKELNKEKIGGIYADWGLAGVRMFINEQGVLFQTQMQWQSFPPHRAWVSYNPATKETESIRGKDEIYDLLWNAIGGDVKGRAYLQNHFSLSQLLKNGELSWTEEIGNIVTSVADQKVFISNYVTGKVNLRIFTTEGDYIKSQEIEIPVSSEDGGAQWNLIHVSKEGNLYIFGGADSLHQGRLLIFSPEGKLIKRQSPPPDLLPIQSSLQLTWSVDSQGRIYLPVLEPDGVRVMRMSRE